MRLALPLLGLSIPLGGCADSNLGTFNEGPLAATFSATSEKPAEIVAQCLTAEFGEGARLERDGDVYNVSAPRGLGTLGYRVIQRVDSEGSLVQYDSEMGRGHELDKVEPCL